MDDLSVIDQFLQVFTQYIDSGFGLLGGDVAFLTTILIGIDITLAGLFWAFSENTNVIAQLVKKVLYVGFFAWIIGNFAFLSGIVFDSFAQLGITATGSQISAADLMRPGFVASVGFDAGTPLLDTAFELTGPISFFENAMIIFVLGFSWLVIIIAFFILAVQLFVTILEFKLTALAGFVLIPFALWNKTTFLAERVLGNVVSSGVKLMVLTIIVGIGSTLFAQFTNSFLANEITISQALSTVLGAIAVFGLGIFGPGIASGLITGAPQLGAGAAIGTVGAGVAGAAVGVGAARLAAGGAANAVRAGATVAGGTNTAFNMGRIASGATGATGVAAGAAGVARAGGDAAKNLAMQPVNSIKDAFSQGQAKGFQVTGGSSTKGSVANAATGTGSPSNDNWAARFERKQNMRDAGHMTLSTVRGGDGAGGGAAPALNDREDDR